MLKEREDFLRQIAILLDALVVGVLFVLSFAVRRHFHDLYRFDFFPLHSVVEVMTYTLNDYLIVLFILMGTWCVALYINGMYNTMRTKSLFEISLIVVKAALFTVIVFSVLVFLLKLEFVSRFFFIIFMVLSTLALVIEKMALYSALRSIRRRGLNFRRIIIVGTGKRALELMKRLNTHPEWGIRCLGLVYDSVEKASKEISDADIIGHVEDITKICGRHSVDEVIFMVPRARLTHIENAIYECEVIGVKVTIALDLFNLKFARAQQTELDGIPLLSFDSAPSHQWQLFFKRTLDVLVSGAGLVLLGPFLLAAAVLIKVTSKGPILFLQKRTGVSGRKFVLFKFRTMQKGAHRKQKDLDALNTMTGPVFKIKKDPRLTTIGGFLRRFSIDELPQLLNVFLGHMSLVGPRPAPQKEVLKYQPWQRRRLSMRPGITCLWQVGGRNKIRDFDQWMKLDLEYIDKWSLSLDFYILLKTIPVVLFGIGAY